MPGIGLFELILMVAMLSAIGVAIGGAFTLVFGLIRFALKHARNSH